MNVKVVCLFIKMRGMQLYAGRIGQPMARALVSRIVANMASPRYSAESGITWQEAADAAKSFMDTYGSKFVSFTEETIDGILPYNNALLLYNPFGQQQRNYILQKMM